MHYFKRTILLAALIVMTFTIQAAAAPVSLDEYLLGYTYESRKEMKASSEDLIRLLKEGKAVLVDIRFKEEQAAWSMGFGLKIPINELPKRLKELPKDKIIVTACPHKDRATIAMVYLRTLGYDARYLTDGLLGLQENLRGDSAFNFMKSLADQR